MILQVKLTCGAYGHVLVTDMDTLVHAGPRELINVFVASANGDEHQHAVEKRDVVFCDVVPGDDYVRFRSGTSM